MIKRRTLAIACAVFAVSLLGGCAAEKKLDRTIEFYDMTFMVPSDMKEEHISDDVWTFTKLKDEDDVESFVVVSRMPDNGDSAEDLLADAENTYVVIENDALKQDIDAHMYDPFILDGREVSFARYEITDTWDDGTVDKFTDSYCFMIGADEVYMLNVFGDILDIENVIDTVSFS